MKSDSPRQPKNRGGGTSTRRVPGPFVLATLVVLAVALAWLVATRTMVGALASSSPAFALQLRPNFPAALTTLADRLQGERIAETKPDALSPAPKPTDPGTSERDLALASSAYAAVAGDPFDAKAIRILAQVAEAAGDQARAASLYQASARLSIRESIAVDWLLRRAAETGDYRTVVKHADTLLRTNSSTERGAIGVLANVAERPNGAADVVELLAQNPPWRVNFFSVMPSYISDARTPLQLLQALAKTDHPPNGKEVNPYLDFLISKGFHELAYYAWLQFIPQDQLAGIGLLYNGDFQQLPSGSPFDWRYSMGRGAISDVIFRKEQSERRALYLELGPGRVEFSVNQSLLLSPGAYRLSGEVSGKLIGKGGVRWKVTCVGAQVLGESDQFNGILSAWAPFDFAFVVPADKCRSQMLTLMPDARSASEQLISGKVLFSTLAITPQLSAR